MHEVCCARADVPGNRTIIKYDRMRVVDAGKVVEFDSPLALFDNPAGDFRAMCDKSKIRREDFFTDVG